MSFRPLSSEEREYLTLLKASLDAAFQGAAITLGLAALPLGFLFFALGSRRAPLGDQIALVLAVAILAGLTWAVIAYSGKGQRGRRFGLADMRLRAALARDLEERSAAITGGPVEAKADYTAKLPWQRVPERGAPRRFYLTVAGRRFEVGAARWLATAQGQPLTIEHAAHSGVVLAIDGLRERLPLGETRRGEGEDALGLPLRPG